MTRIREGAFPALGDLNISAHLPDLTRFVTNPHAPANLTSLYAHLPSLVPPTTVREYLGAVGENCKLLTKLYLDLFIPSATGRLSPPQAYAEPLSWADIRPVLSCKQLRTFELTWTSPIVITQGDVEELASSWPSLQVLVLNCLPNPIVRLAPPTLTLRALIPLAAHCPGLEVLGLDIDTNTAGLAHNASVPPPQPFQKLATLCFGLSPIVDTGAVALFLSQLCPLGCEIGPGPQTPDGFDIALPIWTCELMESWAEVGRVLPLLVRTRMQERARREELEREVEDLRMRCRVLETLPPGALNADGSCLVF